MIKMKSQNRWWHCSRMERGNFKTIKNQVGYHFSHWRWSSCSWNRRHVELYHCNPEEEGIKVVREIAKVDFHFLSCQWWIMEPKIDVWHDSRPDDFKLIGRGVFSFFHVFLYVFFCMTSVCHAGVPLTHLVGVFFPKEQIMKLLHIAGIGRTMNR